MTRVCEKSDSAGSNKLLRILLNFGITLLDAVWPMLYARMLRQ
jgi:hypothetical protein